MSTIAPEINLSEIEELHRAKWTQAAREAYHKEHPENFAGDHLDYPIRDGNDVKDAWNLAGHGDNPDRIRKRVKSIAKRLGLESHLPDTAKDDNDKDDDGRAQSPDLLRARDPGLVINPDGSHAAFTGLHIHAHSAFGSTDGNEGMHEHSHEHQNDSNHMHSHSHLDGNWQAKGEENGSAQKASAPDILRTLPSETTIYAPILRVDRAKREVVVRATAEDLDSYGTVIGFDGSIEAFSKWRGNIREMHDPTKAVGRAIQWQPIDETKEIELTLRVSRGAEDTWQKVLDGTLAGASIGARNGKWGKRQWNGKEVPFLERYDLVEVSLVDNPSCPGCDVKVVRSDNLATDVLDFTEETEPQQQTTPDITRVGARVGTNTMMSMHKTRDHMFHGLREQLANCSCDECQGALRCLDPDNDGDIDIVPSLDTDHDGEGASGDGSGNGVMKFVQSEITRHMSPIITRMNGIAARFAATDITPTTAVQAPDPEMTRRLEGLEQKLAGLDEVRSALAEVRGLAEKTMQLSEMIAAQPQQGGPIVNSAALRQIPSNQPDPFLEETKTIERLARAGILNKNQQVEAALYLQRLENGRR